METVNATESRCETASWTLSVNGILNESVTWSVKQTAKRCASETGI